MNPPFSAIFLTTLIGAGQGLFLMLFGTEVWLGGAPLEAQAHTFFVIGSVVSSMSKVIETPFQPWNE